MLIPYCYLKSIGATFAAAEIGSNPPPPIPLPANLEDSVPAPQRDEKLRERKGIWSFIMVVVAGGGEDGRGRNANNSKKA
jgi:hypothetical protein